MASHIGADPTVLNFSIGKPVQIAMKFREPKACASGSRFLISLAGNHPGMRAFVPRHVADQIANLGITADQAFWILKRTKDEFEVSLERPENQDERLSRQLSESVARIPAGRATSPHGELAVPRDGYQGHPPAAAPSPAAAPAPPPAPVMMPAPAAAADGTPRLRTQLEAALCTAVQATHAAQQYARELGSGLTFTSEDVRAMAITLLIGKQQRERGVA